MNTNYTKMQIGRKCKKKIYIYNADIILIPAKNYDIITNKIHLMSY